MLENSKIKNSDNIKMYLKCLKMLYVYIVRFMEIIGFQVKLFRK